MDETSGPTEFPAAGLDFPGRMVADSAGGFALLLRVQRSTEVNMRGIGSQRLGCFPGGRIGYGQFVGRQLLHRAINDD